MKEFKRKIAIGLVLFMSALNAVVPVSASAGELCDVSIPKNSYSPLVAKYLLGHGYQIKESASLQLEFNQIGCTCVNPAPVGSGYKGCQFYRTTATATLKDAGGNTIAIAQTVSPGQSFCNIDSDVVFELIYGLHGLPKGKKLLRNGTCSN